MILWILYVFIIVSNGLEIEGLRPDNYRLFCYMSYWAIEGDYMRFDDLDAAVDKCTHVIYIHAGIDEESFKIFYPYAQGLQFATGKFEKSVAFKKKYPHLKALISIGGSQYSKVYSKIVSEQSHRKAFIQAVVDFLKANSFDGMELKWRALGKGSKEEGENFILLSKGLKREFDKHGLIYYLAIPGGNENIDSSPDPKEVSKYVHYYYLATTIFHGYYEGIVNPAFPLYANDTQNVDFTIQYHLKKGVDRNKLILGLSSYFATYKTFDPLPRGNQIVGQPAKIQDSLQGPETELSGYIAHYELCREMEKDATSWEFVLDAETKSPFAYTPDGENVVSIETEETYEEKVKYALKNKLGGLAYYSLDKDDFRPSCKSSKKPYPLLDSVERSINKYSYLMFDDIRKFSKLYGSSFFWNGMKL